MPSMPRLRGVEISPGTWPGSPARSPTPLRTSGCRSSSPCRVEGAIRMDYLAFIFRAINNLLTQNLGFFDAMGQNLFRAFATILVVWHGVKSALSSASVIRLIEFDSFAALLLTVSFGFGMVNNYINPIPGLGTSFHNLLTYGNTFLVNTINQ